MEGVGEATRDHLSGTRSALEKRGMLAEPMCTGSYTPVRSILKKTRQWGAGFPASQLRNWGPGRRPSSQGLGRHLTWLPGPA